MVTTLTPITPQSVSKSYLPPSKCLESNHLNSFYQFQSDSNLHQNLPCYSKSLQSGLPTSTPAHSVYSQPKQPEINQHHSLPLWSPTLFRTKTKFLHTQPLFSYLSPSSHIDLLSVPGICQACPTLQDVCIYCLFSQITIMPSL